MPYVNQITPSFLNHAPMPPMQRGGGGGIRDFKPTASVQCSGGSSGASCQGSVGVVWKPDILNPPAPAPAPAPAPK